MTLLFDAQRMNVRFWILNFEFWISASYLPGVMVCSACFGSYPLHHWVQTYLGKFLTISKSFNRFYKCYCFAYILNVNVFLFTQCYWFAYLLNVIVLLIYSMLLFCLFTQCYCFAYLPNVIVLLIYSMLMFCLFTQC